MNKSDLKQILIQQKQEVQRIFAKKIIAREVEAKAVNLLDSPLIKVIIGVRRSGKSILAHRLLSGKPYGYVNFDDEKLVNLKAEDLNDLLEVLLEITPNCRYLLLDEAQNIAGWELFANRLARQGYNLIITGSNSKLLSKELATHLTGRHVTIELYPFSFREFLAYKNIAVTKDSFYLTADKARLRQALDQYITEGAFPETFELNFKTQYLQDLYNKIIAQDVAARHKIRYVKDMKEIALYGLTNFGARISYTKLKNIFDIKSIHTVKNYLEFLEESYILFLIEPYFFKLKERVKGFKKIYGIDSGLIKAVTAGPGSNFGRLMENVVLLELKRRREEVYFYQNYTGEEVDFVIRQKSNISQLIQVCFNLDDPDTRRREIKALISASQKLKCHNLLIITDDYDNEEVVNGRKIKFTPMVQWLLENKS